MYILISILTLVSNVYSKDKPSLLITYFKPFDKKEYNASSGVAFQIKRKLSEIADVKTCELSVEYDRTEKEFDDCLSSIKTRPDIVLSLGETTDAEVLWEKTALNLDDHPAADESGETRVNWPIVRNGPKYYELSLFKKLKKEIGNNHNDVRYSQSVNKTDKKIYYFTFVCNHIAYYIADKFNQLDKAPLYGFVHVPSTGADHFSRIIQADETSTAILETLEKLL